MKKKLPLDLVVLVAATVLLLAIWTLSYVSTGSPASLNSASAAAGASGLDVFTQMKLKQKKGSAHTMRHAVLEDTDLKGYDSLYIISPRTLISEREQKIILKWVRAGGHLVLSFRDELSMSQVTPFLRSADERVKIDEFEGFENQEPTLAKIDQSDSLFHSGETIDFYAAKTFHDSQCIVFDHLCFFRRVPLGDGEILAFAGLPPFSNSLIGRDSNPELASRLGLRTGQALFDEYHLSINQKTLWDLVSDPSFCLPILGFIVGLLLFFFFGTGDFNETILRENAEVQAPRRSFHSLNQKLLQGALLEAGSLRDACLAQARFLSHQMPKKEQREAIDRLTALLSADSSEEDYQAAAINLIQFHKTWLESRRRV